MLHSLLYSEFSSPLHSTEVVNSNYHLQTREKDRHVGLLDEMKDLEGKFGYKPSFLLWVMEQSELG